MQKLKTGFLKVPWLSLHCFMSSIQIINSCEQSGFSEFHKIIDNKTIDGHRLANMNMVIFEKYVFTNLQCLDVCLRTEQCASIDVKKENTQRSCRINRAAPKYFIVENVDWTHINISSEALEEILASAGEECKGKETEETSSTLESLLQKQTNVTMNEYCETTALNVTSCAEKKKQGNCRGAWKAHNLADGWCCVDPASPSNHCCCRIPQ